MREGTVSSWVGLCHSSRWEGWPPSSLQMPLMCLWYNVYLDEGRLNEKRFKIDHAIRHGQERARRCQKLLHPNLIRPRRDNHSLGVGLSSSISFSGGGPLPLPVLLASLLLWFMRGRLSLSAQSSSSSSSPAADAAVAASEELSVSFFLSFEQSLDH